MQFGRYYEEFEVGAVYKHWPGKTVTEYDDHLFCLLTMNHHPLHMDAHYAQETTDFGRNVVVGNYVYSLLLGMSVPDVSGKAIANLEVESLKHTRPTFHGDTIYGETEVLDKTESRSKDDRGVVYVETRGYKQDGTVVCTFRRKVMVPKRSYGDARGGEQPGRPVPAGLARALAGECVPLPQGVVQQGDQRQARQRRRRRTSGRRWRRRPRAACRRRPRTGSRRSAYGPRRTGRPACRARRPARSPRPSPARRRRRPSSPGSTRPPGTDHSPRPGSLPRWISSSRPSAS